MTPSPARFTFDLDLGRSGDRQQSASDSGFAALLQKARMEGYAEGFAEGERSATAAAAQLLGTAAETLGDAAMQLLAGLDATLGASRRDAVELAASIGRKLAANLLAREPTAEIEALLTECLASLEAVPHLVIRCHPDLADAVRELAATRIADSGFTGRLIVMGDPDRSLGDGRIEWADGGLVRDMAAISAGIDKSIAAYLAADGTRNVRKSTP